MKDIFDRAYNRLMELKVKLGNETNEEYREFLKEKIKEVEYELAYLEFVWMYE